MFTRLVQPRRNIDSGQPFTLPAPTGGLNARDAYDRMPPQDAISLKNWVPDFDAVRARKGRKIWSTIGADITALYAYEGFSSQGILTFTADSIFDSSISGAGSSISTGLSGGDWVAVNFNDYLVMVNGADTPKKWDGASMTDASFSAPGLTPANLCYVEAFNQRLYFVEKDTSNLWYGDAGAVTGGTLQLFDIGQVAQRGGYIQAVSTWSFDGGNDIKDYLVIVMSTGEVIAYSGTNPSDASNWTRAASYQMSGVPFRRCVMKLDGDLLVTTREGVVPLSLVAKIGNEALVDRDPTFGKVRKLFRDSIALYASQAGWWTHRNETGDLAIWNVAWKVGGVQTTRQYILNNSTKAWAEWDIPATAWASVGGTLYIACQQNVYTYTGQNDAGQSISLVAESAFVRLGGARKKQVTALRPYLQITQNENAAIEVNADYRRESFSSLDRTLSAADEGGNWDLSAWDEDLWGPQENPYSQWLVVGRTGVTFSVYMRLSVNGLMYEWRGTDMLAQDGGIF